MSKQKFAVALDIGGTKTLVGLVGEDGEIAIQRRFPTLVAEGPELQLSKCVQTADECLREAGIPEASIVGVGVTVPGLADPNNGLLVYAPYAGWRDVPVRAILNRAWPGRRIEIANDVNACAHGELVFGGGKQYRNFLWVTISTGIGSGIVINRQIYEGESLFAGELGHVVVEPNEGRRCGCGHLGCLEAQASGTAITRRAKQLIADGGPDSALARYLADEGMDATAESVARAARAGVRQALDIYAEAGSYIGRAFSYAVNLLNPGCIFVGGGVSLSLDLLEPAIRAVIVSSVIGEANQQIPILPTSLGYEAGLKGAASLVFSEP